MATKNPNEGKNLLRTYRDCHFFDAGPVQKNQPDGEGLLEVYGRSNNLCHTETFSRNEPASLNKAIERAKEWVNKSQKEDIAATPSYSDKDLEFFKGIIDKKLAGAHKELEYLQEQIKKHEDTDRQPSDTDSTPEEITQMASMVERQQGFIGHLQAALKRIEEKTYGICRVTGKLIDKARLTAVPHATLSIEAKQMTDKALGKTPDTKPAKEKKVKTPKPKVSVSQDEPVKDDVKKVELPQPKAQEKIRSCRVCGCTQNDCRQCIEKTGSPCHWVEDDLCSACVEGPEVKVKDERASALSDRAEPQVKEEAPAVDPQPTNFFTQLMALASPGKVDVSLRIMEVNGKLTVSFMPKHKSTNLPVNCTATAEAFDKDFFKQILPQVKEIPDLITHNIEEVKKHAEESGRDDAEKKGNSSTPSPKPSKPTASKNKKWKKPAAKPAADKKKPTDKKKPMPAPKTKPVARKSPGPAPKPKAQKVRVEKPTPAPVKETPAAEPEPSLFG